MVATYTPPSYWSMVPVTTGKSTVLISVKSTKYTPQLCYADSNQTVSPATFVLYWVFNDDTKNGIRKRNDNHQYYCGIGITDKEGYLLDLPCPGCKQSCKVWSVEQQNGATHVHYATRSVSNKCPALTYAKNKLNVPEKGKAGFSLLPSNTIKNFKTIALEKLTDDTKYKDCWIKFGSASSADDTTCKISVPRSLNNWGALLKSHKMILFKLLKIHNDITTEDNKYIAEIEGVKTYLGLTLKYPNKNTTEIEEESLKNLLAGLTKVQTTIRNEYINGKVNVPGAHCLKKIDQYAVSIWNILNGASFNKQMHYYIDHKAKYPKTQCGPITEYENGWETIDQIKEECYDVLRNTSLDTKVFEEHISPLLDYITNIDTIPVAQKNTPLEKLYEKLLKPIASAGKHPGTIITLACFADFPGPQCFLTGVIDSYGAHIAKKYFRNNKRQGAKLLANIIKYFSLGTVSISDKDFLPLIKSKDLKNCKKMLSNICKEITCNRSPGLAVTGRILQGLFVIFCIAVFVDKVHDSEEITLRSFADIIASYAPASCGALAGYELVVNNFRIASRFSLGAVATSLGNHITIVGCMAICTISTIDFFEACKENDYYKGGMNLIQGAGAVTTIVGTLILGGSTFIFRSLLLLGLETTLIAGVGLPILIIGIALGVISTIGFALEDYTKQPTEKFFEQIRTRLQKSERFTNEYSQHSALKKLITGLTQLENQVKWWGLSFNAIQELHNLGLDTASIARLTAMTEQSVIEITRPKLHLY